MFTASDVEQKAYRSSPQTPSARHFVPGVSCQHAAASVLQQQFIGRANLIVHPAVVVCLGKLRIWLNEQRDPLAGRHRRL